MAENAIKKPGRPIGTSDVDQKKIFKTTLKVIADKGYEAATMKEIAEEAAVSRTSLNYHFGSKEILWKQSVSYLTQQFIKEFNEHQKFNKDLEGLQLLKMVVRQIVHFNARFPEFHKIATLEMMKKTDRSHWITENMIKPLFAQTKDLFKTLRDQGVIKIISPQHQSSLLLGMANTIYLNAVIYEKIFEIDPFDHEQIDRHADAVVEVFFHGIVA